MGEEDADEVLHQKTERKKQEVSYSRPTAKKESRVSTSVMQVAYVIFWCNHWFGCCDIPY